MNNSLNFWRVNFWCVFLTFLLAYRIKAADMQSSVQKNKPKQAKTQHYNSAKILATG